MKKTSGIKLAAGLLAAGLALTACGGDSGNGEAADGDVYQVAIGQYVTHPSLDANREGFKQAFADAGVEVEFDEQNAAADQATLNNIFGGFAQNSDLDLIFAIATPSAIAAATNITDRPILFGSVTDPVAANLVEDWDAPGGNVTGVSDLNPVADQLALIKEFVPDATVIGVPYSSAEANSLVQVELAREAAAELGMELEEVTVTNSSEVQQAANSLSGVDAVWVPTDNVVVSALESVLSFGIDNQIPVFSAEPDSVERGAVATIGVDYHAQGVQIGEMALDILQNGTDPATIPVKVSEGEELRRTINPDAAARMGLELTEEQQADADIVG